MPASEELGIEYTLTGLNKVVQGFFEIERGSAAATTEVIKLNRALARTVKLNAQIKPAASGAASGNGHVIYINQVGGSGSGRTVRNVGSNRSVGSSVPSGPNQRRTYLRNLLQSGSLGPDQHADVLDAMHRNDRRLNANKPRNKVMDMIMSTRFGNKGISPLIGRTMAAAGIGAEVAAPFLLVAAAAVAVVAGLDALAKASSEAVNSFQRFVQGTGSTSANAGRLAGIGSALGLSPSSTLSMAQSLQEHITGSPMGMAAGMQAGVFNLPGMFGNQDIGNQLQTALERLRGMRGNRDMQTRVARALGLEDALPGLNNVSDSQFAFNKRIGEQSAAITGSPAAAGAAADYQASVAAFEQSTQTLMAALGVVVLPTLTTFFNTLADDITRFNQFVTANAQPIEDALSTIFGPLMNMMMGPGAASGTDAHTDALNRNTEATRNNTNAMMAPGTYGSGNATRTSAMPGKWNGQALAQAGDMNALQLSSI